MQACPALHPLDGWLAGAPTHPPTVMSGRSCRIRRPVSDCRMRSLIATIAGRPVCGRHMWGHIRRGRWCNKELEGSTRQQRGGTAGVITTHLWFRRWQPPSRLAGGSGTRPTATAVPLLPSPSHSAAHVCHRLQAGCVRQGWRGGRRRGWAAASRRRQAAAASGGRHRCASPWRRSFLSCIFTPSPCHKAARRLQ